ncbi:MAG: YebC/PmpR family DNA-binding transcriptional regulator [bacterium]|nr:YebC/PmpR family DNA-binding transcriptional regulator [bacterium]
MSRHNKWSKVKNQKGAADQRRAASFSKLARAISVCAREGGGDPTFNFKLRLVVDRAKAVNMPKDAIERAIARGTGEGSDVAIVQVMYEGFAPGGAAVLVECLTDNSNRTLAEVRQVFVKRGGNFGNEGSVRWMFEHRGIVQVAAPSASLQAPSKEQVELDLIEAGAEDVQWEEDGLIVVTAVEGLQQVQEAVEKLGLSVEDAGLRWIAKQETEIAEADHEQFEQFIGVLEELDDVQEVHTNAA